MRGHVILIAFYFPPLFGRGGEDDARFGAPSIGGLRPALMAKYLPRLGWRVTVITRGAEGLPEDERIGERLRILRLSGNVHTLGVGGEHGPPPPPPPKLKALLCHVRDLAEATATAWFGDPPLDLNWLWARRALRRAKKLLLGEKADVVWSSSPPEAVHELALGLATEFGCPFIADFRDGWLFEPLRVEIQSEGERRRREAQLEAQTIARATRVCCASSMVAEDFARRFPAAAGRISVVRSGVDSDELRGLPLAPPPENRPLKIVYAGRLSFSHSRRSAEALWKAAAQVLHADGSARDKLAIEFAGEFTDEERALPASYGLNGIVRSLPPLSRRAALELQSAADACLIIAAPGHKSAIPGKTFELLALGKPILALCEPDSEPARLLSGRPQAKVVAPQDADGIARVLKDWIAQRPRTVPVAISADTPPESVTWMESLFASISTQKH